MWRKSFASSKTLSKTHFGGNTTLSNCSKQSFNKLFYFQDQNQVLFRACGKMKADVECTTPVEAIFDDTTCQLHVDIPQIRSYSQIRVSRCFYNPVKI